MNVQVSLLCVGLDPSIAGENDSSSLVLFNFLKSGECMHVYMYAWKSEDSLLCQFSPSTMWTPEIEPRLAGLATSSFTCGAISLAPFSFLMNLYSDC